MQPVNHPQEVYINQPIPNGQRRCTWKPFDACDYITMGTALGFAITCIYSPQDSEDVNDFSLMFSIFSVCILAGKKLGEFCDPFSCRDRCMAQLFPERYGIPNYTLQENRN
jgi:hypothetical protein